MDEKEYQRASRNASKAYKNSDKGRWVAAYWAAKVVGTYTLQTRVLAVEMGVSSDTVENLAHAYEMYEALRKEPEFTRQVVIARKLPCVYMSHFLALYKAWNLYSLTLDKVFDILIDIVQANGELSSRDVDNHTQSKYNVERPWWYYCQRTQKAVGKTLACPDLPDEIRSTLVNIYNVLGDKS